MTTLIAALALITAVTALIISALTAFLLIAMPEYLKARKKAQKGEESGTPKRNDEFNRQIRNLMRYDGGDGNG